MARTEVVNAAVAVLISADGQVLLGRRPEGKPWAGWWEFPGGKIEEGETPLEGLQRELHEELGIEAIEVYRWLTRTFDYPEKTVKLHFFILRSWSGEPHGKEGQQLAWQYPQDLSVGPMLPANEPILKALNLLPVHAITNLGETAEEIFLAQLDRALSRGLRLVQVREKHLDREALRAFSKKVIEAARPYAAKVILNGDIELARELNADGVHLSSSQLMSATSRPDLPTVGASCHCERELHQASLLGLDYVTLSPVRPTLSHPGQPTLGWQRFAEMIVDYPLPVYALGGMEMDDISEAWRHGAHGVAMQRKVWAA
ncbi:8-oxo-dGTP diphosphatase [Methylophilaceae bacterium]|nr:8-oxo-dGTP diphosphatase [Methylophilaceae bacterium]